MSRAFTLIEVIIAIAIVAILSVVLTSVFISTIRTNTKNEIGKEVKQNGDFALDTMTRLLQNARQVTSTCLNVAQSSISFNNPDGGNTTLECRQDGALLRIASTSAGFPSYLTSSSVTLQGIDCSSAFTIICAAAGDGTQSVKINFTITQANSSPSTYEQAANTYGTTVTLRNSGSY